MDLYLFFNNLAVTEENIEILSEMYFGTCHIYILIYITLFCDQGRKSETLGEGRNIIYN